MNIRYIMGNQILGYTFIELIKNNIYEIKILDIGVIQNNVTKSIRIKNNAILNFTERSLYETLSIYEDFFELEESYVKINKNILSEIEKNVTAKKRFINRLERYFLFGIPLDINFTVKEEMENFLSEVDFHGK